jgi:hypothetical protein
MTVTSLHWSAYDGYTADGGISRTEQNQGFEGFGVRIGTTDVNDVTPDLPDSADEGAPFFYYSGVTTGYFAKWVGVQIQGGELQARHSSLYGLNDGTPSSMTPAEMTVTVSTCGIGQTPLTTIAAPATTVAPPTTTAPVTSPPLTAPPVTVPPITAPPVTVPPASVPATTTAPTTSTTVRSAQGQSGRVASAEPPVPTRIRLNPTTTTTPKTAPGSTTQSGNTPSTTTPATAPLTAGRVCVAETYSWNGYSALHSSQQRFTTGVVVRAPAGQEILVVRSIVVDTYDGNSPNANPSRADQAQPAEQVGVKIGAQAPNSLTKDLPDTVAQGAVSSNYSGLKSASLGGWAGVATTGGSVVLQHSSLYGVTDPTSSSVIAGSVNIIVDRCI